MSFITLTTDFGNKDGYVGTMKGVIWKICPKAQIADITHEIPPHSIFEGAFILWRSYSYFPVGSIHIAIVDPGVGSKRRPIAMKIGNHFFIGPDNGIFTPIINDAENLKIKIDIYHLIEARFFLGDISTTFHGRDLFAPAGAHLANGVSLSELGPKINNPIRIDFPVAKKTARGWKIHVLSIDRFGNLVTDFRGDQINETKKYVIKVKDSQIKGIAKSYESQPQGNLICLVNSAGLLEIAGVNCSAAQITRAKIGDDIEVVESD